MAVYPYFWIVGCALGNAETTNNTVYAYSTDHAPTNITT